jgi:thiol-disulfide isomerase/thioredoxin
MMFSTAALSICLLSFQQPQPQPAQQQPPQQQVPPETQALMDAVSDANNSPPDVIRNLEAFLAKFPNTAQRNDLIRVLARSAIDAKDDRRTILYGEQLLKFSPDDMLTLDRVARALLNSGGKENAEKSLQYSRAFAEKVEKAPSPTGPDAARRQDDRDRGESRALIYQSRAELVLDRADEAEKLAAQAFRVFPSEESARQWAAALDALGRTKDAVEHYADAFAVSDKNASDADRKNDRERLADLYRKVHHSEKGLGDLVLEAYDRTAALVEARRSKLAAIDPNFLATDAMQFHLTGLDGGQLDLGSLKGKVIVFDFWATWCTPCRMQHGLYEQVKERFKDRTDVVFLAIDTDEDHNVVGSFLDSNYWNKKVYFEDGLQRFLQITSIPTTILIDKQGHLVSRMAGFLPDKFVDQLTNRIRTALTD